MKTKPASPKLLSVVVVTICAFTFCSPHLVLAQQDFNQPGSFDQLVESFGKDNTIILEGPALHGPTEVRSKSITQVPGLQNGERIIMGEQGGPIPGPFDDMPSVISRTNTTQYQVDDPFLDVPPANQIPTIQGPVLQGPIPGQAPSSGWRRNGQLTETIPPPTILPELTAPRPIPNQTRQRITPAIPSAPAPSQLVVPEFPQTGYRQPDFAPRIPREIEPYDLDCPIERARRERLLRAQSGYQSGYPPTGQLRRTGYVPYGGRGLDREYERRTEQYVSRYLEYKRMELELLRQRYERTVPRYVPYGGNRGRGYGFGF